MSEDPKRLSEEEGTATALGIDLHRVRSQAAGYDAVAGLARFEAALAVPQAVPGADATSAAVGTSKAVWVAAAIVGAATAGAVAWALSSSGPDPATHASTPPTASATSEEPHTVPEEPPPAAVSDPPSASDPVPEETAADTAEVSPPPDAPVPTTAGPQRIDRSPRPAKSTPEPKPELDFFAAEMRATTAARSALKTSPARAIKLVDAAQEKFGEGTLGPERRGIKVLALFALGKTAAAQREAAAYLSRNPKGTYADRIRAASSQ